MKVHEFTEKFMEHSIIFRVIVMKNSNADIEDAKLEDCAWIWVGTPSCPEFKVLSVALNTRYVTFIFKQKCIFIFFRVRNQLVQM